MQRELYAEQKGLADELCALCKEQSEALESAGYIRMNEEEGRKYDERHIRIERICELLGKDLSLIRH
jgi:hypothetical protein